MILKQCLNPDNGYGKEIVEKNKYFLESNKPKKFHEEDEENSIIKIEKDYYEECVILSKYSNTDPKELDLISFYTLFERVNNMGKKNKHIPSL